MKLSAVMVCLFSQMGCLEIGGVKHPVYNGQNLIGRDTSCSVSLTSKVGLDYLVHFAYCVLTSIDFIYHRIWDWWK
jgi:hypothetical protein